MYTIKQYIANTKALTNSIVFKINEIPMVVNSGVKNTIGYIPTRDDPDRLPKTEWKYYLNLAGIMHRLDQPVKIRVIETETYETLTTELLNKYPITRIELQKYDKYYNELLAEYPEYVRFIHGCIDPINPIDAINAEEGSILAYCKDFVEDNEYYLIPELEAYIKRLLSRWHVKPYTVVDELYLASLIAFVYSAIFLKILNLRLSRINTFQVHSFHLEHFFRSHMDIWDDVNILNKKSLFWLYKNMDVMMHNVGREATFIKIYNRLFDMNNIGIGSYLMKREDPTFSVHTQDLDTPVYVRNKASLLSSKLNRYYLTNNNQSTSIEGMINKQFDTLPDVNKNLPDVFKKYAKDVALSNIERNLSEEIYTKVLDIDTNKIFKKTGLDLFSLTMDYWIYCLQKDKLYKEKVKFEGNVHGRKKTKSFTEEETEFLDYDNKVYTVTPEIGILMFVKLLLFSTNSLDLKITGLNFYNVLNFDKDNYQEVIDTKLIDDGMSYAIVKAFEDYLPNELDTFPTIDSFKSFLNDSIEFSKYLWVFMSNTQNFIITQNIKRVFENIKKQGYYELSKEPKTIDQLLNDRGIDYKISQYTDIESTMKRMLTTFTGVELDQEDKLLSNIDKYRTIIKKLTSYSLHALGSTGINKDINVYYNNPTILATNKGWVYVYGLYLKGLEDPLGRLHSYSRDYLDWIGMDVIPTRLSMVLAKLKPVQGDMILNYGPIIQKGKPTEYSLDFIEEPSYNFNKYTWFNNFLKVKQMELDALEDRVDISERHVDNLTTPDGNRLPLRPQFVTYEKVKGDMIVSEGAWLNQFGSYDFKDMPTAWFRPDFKRFLTVYGLDLEPLEDTIGKISKTKSEQINNDVKATNLPLQPKVDTIRDTEGDMVLNEPNDQNDGSYDFSYNYDVLDISTYVQDNRYVKIGLLAFKTLNMDGTPDKTDSLVTYITEDALNIERDTIKDAVSIGIRGTNIEPDIKEKMVGPFKVNIDYDDRDFKPVRFKKFRWSRASDRPDRHNEEFKSKIDRTIKKSDVIGLAMLPFRLELDGDNTKISKLMYIGLVDKEGNMDIFDTSTVKILTYNDLIRCPVVKRVPYIFQGISLPLQDMYSKQVLTVNVDVRANYKLRVNEKGVLPLEDVDHYFFNYNNMMVGKNLRYDYDKDKSTLILTVDKDLNPNAIKVYQYLRNDTLLYEKFKVYAYNDNYLKRERIKFNVSPFINGYGTIAINKGYFKDKRMIEYIGINDILFKIKDVKVSSMSNNLFTIIKSINPNLKEYILPNSTCLLIYPDVNNLVVELDPYNDRMLEFHLEEKIDKDIQSYIEEQLYNLDVPNYVISTTKDIKELDNKNFNEYIGFYQIGKIKYYDLIPNNDPEEIKKALLSKFDTEKYDWLKNLEIK